MKRTSKEQLAMDQGYREAMRGKPKYNPYGSFVREMHGKLNVLDDAIVSIVRAEHTLQLMRKFLVSDIAFLQRYSGFSVRKLKRKRKRRGKA